MAQSNYYVLNFTFAVCTQETDKYLHADKKLIALSPRWTCQNCGESSELQFRCCWKCGTDRTGVVDPSFKTEMPATESTVPGSKSLTIGFVWMLIWFGFCAIVIAGSNWIEAWLPEFWTVRLSLAAILLLICLLLGVSINVASQLYLWLRNYVVDDVDPNRSTSTQQKQVQLERSDKND